MPTRKREKRQFTAINPQNAETETVAEAPNRVYRKMEKAPSTFLRARTPEKVERDDRGLFRGLGFGKRFYGGKVKIWKIHYASRQFSFNLKLESFKDILYCYCKDHTDARCQPFRRIKWGCWNFPEFPELPKSSYLKKPWLKLLWSQLLSSIAE